MPETGKNALFPRKSRQAAVTPSTAPEMAKAMDVPSASHRKLRAGVAAIMAMLNKIELTEIKVARWSEGSSRLISLLVAVSKIREKNRRPNPPATDIAVADQSDVMSILVLSGESTREDVKTSDVKPNVILEDLSEITKML